MKLESHVAGIPLALLVFVLIDAAVVLIPVAFMQAATQNEIKNVQVQNSVEAQAVNQLLITPTPEATPTAVPTFVQKALAPVVKTTIKPVAK